MWCNVGILCGPILLFWTYVRGDLDLPFNFPYLLSPGSHLQLFVLAITFNFPYLLSLICLSRDNRLLRFRSVLMHWFWCYRPVVIVQASLLLCRPVAVLYFCLLCCNAVVLCCSATLLCCR
ncbi:uncharacterized protein [Spinacia oleracea]|uniref:Uncharacterized protein n=1 Tax=Spinacia oleracea TaxID=3562 RepID=A0ABM3RES4_SPIOL|nr:uncharacterized protein LOC130469184 [Spinacia oleracea]